MNTKNNVIVYRGAKEIGAVVGEDPKAIPKLVKDEKLPAWRRNNKGLWRALPCDLQKWIADQGDKYKT